MITATSLDAAPTDGFVADEALLSGVLEDVICATEGSGALELHRRAVALGRRSRSGDAAAADELAALVAELDVPEIELLIRMLTCWHQLMNLAEDNDRVRRLRARELSEAPAPRRGSLRDAITRLADGGTSATELHDALARAEVQLVLTAHPTEARRRTTVNKLARIFAMLRSLDERLPVPGEQEELRRRIAAAVQELWTSDELRAVSPTVLDEVRAGLIYFTSTLAAVVPALYRDLDAAVRESYPDDDVVVPPLLTFGSWMGGDRDGNPNVTPDMTAGALAQMKEACLTHLEGVVGDLAGRITVSARLAGEPEQLRALLDDAQARLPALGEHVLERNPGEPYRQLFKLLAERVRATRKNAEGRYHRAQELVADLRVAQQSLRDQKAGFVADDALRDVIRQVEVFGFHFARLDVRETPTSTAAPRRDPRLARRAGGRCDPPEDERQAVRAREILDRRPLIPGRRGGASARQRASRRDVPHDAQTAHGDDAGAGAYIVSRDHGRLTSPDLLLMKEVGRESRRRRRAGCGSYRFESGDTLRALPRRCARCSNPGPPRRGRCRRRAGDHGRRPDSNKDAGYVASGWGIYRASRRWRRGMRRDGVPWQFFHGAAAPLPRRRGRAKIAILAQPTGTVAANEGHRAGRDAVGEVLGHGDRPPRARADDERGPADDARRRRLGGR